MTELDRIVFRGPPIVQLKIPNVVKNLRILWKAHQRTPALLGWGVGFVGVILSAGCVQESLVSKSPARYADIVLRVAAPDDATLREILDRHGGNWSSACGAIIQRVEVGHPADVVFLRPWDLGRLADELLAIDVAALRKVESYEYGLFLREQLNHTMDWAGRALALPVISDARVIVFRSDLFIDPRHALHLPARMRAQANRLQRAVGPATWQEFTAVAAYFSQQPEWTAGEQTATPRPSLPPLPPDEDDLDREFHLIAASFARPMINSERASLLSERLRTAQFFNYLFDADTGEPLIDSAGFVAALHLLQQLQPYRSTAKMSRPIEVFRRGEAVLAVASLADVARLQAHDSPVRGRFGVARIPGSAEYFDPDTRRMKAAAESDGNFIGYLGHGGWIAGISKNTSQSQVALDFLAYLSSPRVSLEIIADPHWGAGPTRGSHLDSRSIWHNYDLDTATTNQLLEALEATYRGVGLNPVFQLRVRHQADFRRSLVEGIAQALHQHSEPERCLQNVRQNWSQLISNRDAFRQEYRASVGLK
jgi:ABC-type glycerol-3-phosphate transport system substrate-binding protein